MNKVHYPDVVRADRLGAVVTQLGLHTALRRLVPELQSQLPVNPIDFLDVDVPALTFEQDVNAPVAIPHARFTDLPDPLGDSSLIGAARLVVERRTVEPHSPTGLSDRDRPIATHPANQFALAIRLQS